MGWLGGRGLRGGTEGSWWEGAGLVLGDVQCWGCCCPATEVAAAGGRAGVGLTVLAGWIVESFWLVGYQ